MYKKWLKLADSGIPAFADGKVFGWKRIKKLARLVIYNEKFETIWIAPEEPINFFILRGDNIIYTVREKKTVSRNIHDLSLNYELDFPINPLAFKYDETYYYGKDEEDVKWVKFNLNSGEIEKVFKHDITGGMTEVMHEYIIHIYSGYIGVYNKNDLTFLWHRDINTVFPTFKEMISLKVYFYNDSLIILTDLGTVRLNLSDGNLIWKINDNARTLEIVDNIGYACTGLSLYRINLDDGTTSGYGRERHRLPDFEYKGKLYWPSGHQVVYHNGLLWHSTYDSGRSFLIAINPYDGHYEWMHYVDTYERIDEPVFHENKMFLTDSGSTLHIYEKDALENDTDFKKYFKVIE